MINAFRVRNLRSISDTGVIDLKRINIVVGRNSSGKSTLLRVLPLLRQSVEQSTRGPILWFGRLVDFGDFGNAAKDGDVSKGISFEFHVSHRPKRIRTSLRVDPSSRHRTPFYVPNPTSYDFKVIFELGELAETGSSFIRRLEISCGSDTASIELSDNGQVEKVTVAGEVIRSDDPEYRWAVLPGSFLPRVAVFGEYVFADDDGDVDSFWDVVDQPYKHKVVDVLASLVHGKTSTSTVQGIANRLLYGDEKRFHAQLKSVSGMPPKSRQWIEQLTPDSIQIERLRRVVFCAKLPEILAILDDELDAFAKSVSYIEPIRAVAERYYRRQDLAVKEVDSSGANTAMFLSSLPNNEREELSSWLTQNLGFNVEISSGRGHVELMVTDEFGRRRNIADLGFGYSQMIPFLLQIWRMKERSSFAEQSLIAIEQPELHLHPEYQARLAEVFGGVFGGGLVAASRRTSMCLFVETHSDHIVNKIGLMVASRKIRARDVQVLVVEDDANESRVRSVAYDDNGFLDKGWPSGFFTPGMAV